MRFVYHPSVTDDDLDAEDLIDKENGNITVASDVEKEYQPLLRAAPDMLAVLKMLEWRYSERKETPVCPYCGNPKMLDKHADKCRLAEVIAKATGKKEKEND